MLLQLLLVLLRLLAIAILVVSLRARTVASCGRVISSRVASSKALQPAALLVVRSSFALNENLIFNLTYATQNHICLLQVDVATRGGNIISHRRQQLFVTLHQKVQRAVTDVQRGQMRQEIVAHEETQKYKIVNHPLEVVAKRQGILETGKLAVQIFAQ